MGDLGIGGLAQQHARWLLARQNAIANNIANASSPGYRAIDVRPFAETMERTALTMSATSPAHIQTIDREARPARVINARSADVSHSGNTVSINRQMLIANEVRQAYALNTSVVKSFHRLVLSATK